MRAVLSILLMLVIAAPNIYAGTSGNKADLKLYVERLLQEGYNIFRESGSEQEIKKKSAEFIRAHLYFDWMAKYSLGRYRKKTSEDKINKFIEVYTDFIVKAYSDLTSNYNGEKAVLRNIKEIDENLFMVSTEIIKPDSNSSIKIDYLVHKIEDKNTPYLVGDIITEGISILNSQQSEFNSILTNGGIDALIADLQKRIVKGEAKADGSKPK